MFSSSNALSICISREVDCVQVAGSKGITCVVCLQIKQKCGAVWGEEKVGRSAAGSSAGSSRFPGFGEGAIKLF